MESCQCLPVLHVRVAHSRQINSNSSSSNSSAARDRSCLFAQGTCTQCTRGEMVYTHSATNLGILIVITFPGDLNAHASRHALDSLLHADEHRQSAIVVVVVVVVDRTETRVYINITTHALASTLSVSTSCTFHTQSLPLTTSFMLSSTSSLSLSMCVCVHAAHSLSHSTYPRPHRLIQLDIKTHIRRLHLLRSELPNRLHSLRRTLLKCQVPLMQETTEVDRVHPRHSLARTFSLPHGASLSRSLSSSFFSKSMRSIKEP